MDNSAKKLVTKRSLVLEGNADTGMFHLVAIEERPDGGKKKTLLNSGPGIDGRVMGEAIAEAVSRCVESLTGVVYVYDGYMLARKDAPNGKEKDKR